MNLIGQIIFGTLILFIVFGSKHNQEYSTKANDNISNGIRNSNGSNSIYPSINTPSNIKVDIKDPDIGDSAMELIYEDSYYNYYLTSIRSEKIILTFENEIKLTLRESLEQNKITISDLILNGLNVIVIPKK
ncbi:MAG: hypothetical protein FWC91_11965 [Defluviitaleaceae bacterium]|nr:hypothetical protein [Defluviitaleaceae bacterium]